MPKWTVLDKQTREHLGAVERDTMSQALQAAQDEYGKDRYVEVTVHNHERPTAYRPPDFTLNADEIRKALMIHYKLPVGFDVKLTILTNLPEPAVIAQCYDTMEKEIPGIHFDAEPESEPDLVEGLGPGEAPEGGSQGCLGDDLASLEEVLANRSDWDSP